MTSNPAEPGSTLIVIFNVMFRNTSSSEGRTLSIKAKILLASSVFVVGTSFPAWAALGGDMASVQADQVHMQGSRRVTTAAAYTVHEIQGASGTVVREYVSSEGKVFAVAWQGPWLPDMRQLLGNYFDQYTAAIKSQSGGRIGRRPLVIEHPGLTVELAGHSRSFTGRAYIPEQMPSSIGAEGIR
ncbi:MAG TPA: DUF2844 domain-containing protein [Candidatus Acidoferrum sp.]|nr:DUF2844 domain-containing protein [Candidatus Acidoferrum sp.]